MKNIIKNTQKEKKNYVKVNSYVQCPLFTIDRIKRLDYKHERMNKFQIEQNYHTINVLLKVKM